MIHSEAEACGKKEFVATLGGLSRSIPSRLLDIILPQRCISCNQVIANSGIGFCQPCWNEVPWIFGKVCFECGDELPSSASLSDKCLTCRKTSKPYTYCRSIVYYNHGGKALSLRTKYSDNVVLYRFIAKLIYSRYSEAFEKVDFLLPIPLHLLRLLNRGHNQATLLAKELSKLSGVDLMTNILQRIKYTPVLAGYTQRQRRALLSKAFAINRNHSLLLEGKRVMLIDDVITTGITINNCAKLCLSAGAKDVYVLTIARVHTIL